MIRRPPRSTLFPYTSSSDLEKQRCRLGKRHLRIGRPQYGFARQTEALTGNHAAGGRSRSEEHTSELQSRLHLVCRLLLEKKKHTFIMLLVKLDFYTLVL